MPTRKPKKEQPHNETPEDDASDLVQVARLVTRTVAACKGIDELGPAPSSMVKRVILRKDPTFSESDYGIRTWGELMQHLQNTKVVELKSGSAEGDQSGVPE